MNQNRPFLFLQQSCDAAVPFFVERMQRSGLTVIRTFDLHEARAGDTGCSCPKHGTEACDCQMIVLLVYGKDAQPVSLIAHGHNGQTWFSLVEQVGSSNSHLEVQINNVFCSAA